jgi:hypothetical protein
MVVALANRWHRTDFETLFVVIKGNVDCSDFRGSSERRRAVELFDAVRTVLAGE